jgi:hypothetical protein
VQNGFAYYFLLMMARRLPMLLLVLGGSAFAIIRWKRHPRVSLMTLLALIIYIVEAILFILFLYWLPDLMHTMRLTPKAESWLYSVIFFFEDFVFALIIILLVGAAFSGRGGPANKAYPPLPDTI